MKNFYNKKRHNENGKSFKSKASFLKLQSWICINIFTESAFQVTLHTKMWDCSIYNGTPEHLNLIKSVIDTVVFRTRKVFNSNNFPIASDKQELRKSLRNCKWNYNNMDISFISLIKAFKGTVVNRTLPSFHGARVPWNYAYSPLNCPLYVSGSFTLCTVVSDNINIMKTTFLFKF